MADPMEWFVNRLKQLQGFQKMLRGETDKCIMAIRAPAEMGKSWLIQRMRQECGAANLPTLYIDFRDRRPYDYLTIVRTARDQMGATAFNTLTQTINELTGVNIQLSTSGACRARRSAGQRRRPAGESGWRAGGGEQCGRGRGQHYQGQLLLRPGR